MLDTSTSLENCKETVCQLKTWIQRKKYFAIFLNKRIYVCEFSIGKSVLCRIFVYIYFGTKVSLIFTVLLFKLS
jgi:hypothetical protein